MLTSPKLMLPFQIARAIQTYFRAPGRKTRVQTVVISSEVACLAAALCEGWETSLGS